MNKAATPFPDRPKGAVRVFLIRHGETDWNRQRRFQGFTDIPLNANGIAQAKALRSRFEQTWALFASLPTAHETTPPANQAFAAHYSSDLSRAIDTARILIGQDCPLQLHPGLRERNYGHFSGMTAEEMRRHNPLQYEGLENRVIDSMVEGGESLEVFHKRVVNTFTSICANHSDEEILIVAHGGVLDCIYRHCLGLPLQPKRSWLLPNTALNIVDLPPSGKPKVTVWADVSHTDARDWGKNLDEVDGRVA